MNDIWPQLAAKRIDLAEEQDFAIGGMRVMPAARTTEMNDERVELQPRVMQVLVALANARPGVVSREKLIELCWGGRIVGDDALNRCILALRHLAQHFTPAPFAIETVPRVGHRLIESGSTPVSVPTERRRGARLAAAAAVSIVALIALAILASSPGFWPRPKDEQTPTVLVTSGTRDSASQSLARELAVKLGNLGEAQSAGMRLISDAVSRSEEPDLILQASRTADPGVAGANLVLIAAPDRAILWSKEFKQASGNLADLKQQAAFAVARVIGCATEAMANKDPLQGAELKTYLNACAALAGSEEATGSTVPMLEGVVARSPQFVGGWAKLLSAETAQLESSSDTEASAVQASLARHIATARKLQPNLAEAYIGQYMLVPPAQFLERSRILDAAVARNPQHAWVRMQRAIFLQSVGRLKEALDDAREAVKLDPLSPEVRDIYISMLAFAGRMDEARSELIAAERLWPGASSLLMTRYTLNLRLGDPKEALRLLLSGAVQTPSRRSHESFLQARIDPSPENIERALRNGRNMMRYRPGAIENHIQTLAEFHRKDELLQVLLNRRGADALEPVTEVLFHPAFAELHRDPRFMRVAEQFGLLGYWRATDRWPDFCTAADLPYDCKVEAAKIAA
jgi:DNA-binding winged helix-turn-helix (wHTH) protein/tetratricopeptide (TPR) repeat protein